ncbi:MAG: hypothetical protein GY847_35030 [Proteobacteria bacterium]|nr:hypothetical protein [Pseudomonadota bacterium]
MSAKAIDSLIAEIRAEWHAIDDLMFKISGFSFGKLREAEQRLGRVIGNLENIRLQLALLEASAGTTAVSLHLAKLKEMRAAMRLTEALFRRKNRLRQKLAGSPKLGQAFISAITVLNSLIGDE